MEVLMRNCTVMVLWLCGHCLNAQDTLKLSLLFVGDIMQHESQMKAAYDPASGKYIYDSTFKHIKPIISSADLAIANLELTLAGKPYTGYPAFSAPDELLPAIKDAGFDVLVTANNHSVDKGTRGLERTLRLLDSLDIPHTGTFIDTLDYLNHYPLILERNGIKLSLLNYTYGTNGIRVRPPAIVNPIDTARIRKDLMKAAAQKTDAVIVFFHWGEEYTSMPSDGQKDLAAFCLRHGAKLVIGSHPHVVQPMMWDRAADQVIVYSLGNFISGQRARYRNGGAIAHIDLHKVMRPDSTSTTSVADVSYSLVWVYRAADTQKTFKLIPVDEASDTTLVSGPNSRALMREFVKDARSLLDRENHGIQERGRPPKSN